MDKDISIVMGCDLAAYDWKIKFIQAMKDKGYSITDIGCDSSQQGEYTYFGSQVGRKVVSGEYDRGIVVCGTGNGITIAANKVHGVRAALCTDVFSALMSREHNDANVLGLSAWRLTVEEGVKIAELWLFGKFSGGRHEKRIKALQDLEEGREVPKVL
ncbi:MAG: RpiB/LacA/LacB family sugar-phosphate isomerase [Tenuifilaceae bacterium]|jgi:ribose 5-phosphate isomerase B|nr:RpiB/LacA/LacB family sugar-phosphate isomerase [Sphaerochaeta sp.]MDY0255441.1 RpiB/LacA/LacB family sugar-phosphate isomerase [Tenuifilaceae bacterium]